MAVTQRCVSMLLAACALIVSSAPRAAAEDFWMLFENQRVTLIARDMTVSRILDQWARIGGSTVVNADAVKGGPITIRLIDVPEREALEVLLRDAGGYIIAERENETVGPSTIGRILILRKTTAAATDAPPSGSGVAIAAAIDQPIGNDLRPAGVLDASVRSSASGGSEATRANVELNPVSGLRVSNVGGMPAIVPPVLPPGTFVGLGTTAPGPGETPQTVPMLFRQGTGPTGRPGETPAAVPVTRLSSGPQRQQQ